MNEKDLAKLLEDNDYLEKKILSHKKNYTLPQNETKYEIKGHLEKARHNLSFLEGITSDYNDWILVVCYYAVYHAALSLILSKGYFSKNHDATLCILIREFYKRELSKEDIMLLNLFDTSDLLFYVESKQKREEASYSTKIKFNIQDVKSLKLKTILFVNKAQTIIDSEN